MARIWTNSIRGKLSSSITDTDTTLDAAIFAELPVVSSPDTLRLTLDPSRKEELGKPEIVEVTDHVADSTTVTVTRAMETGNNGGSAQAWPSGTTVVHAYTAGEAGDVTTHRNSTSNPHSVTLGQLGGQPRMMRDPIIDDGAVGDGIADDTTALQSSLDSGEPVWLDATFRITSGLTVPDGLQLLATDRGVIDGSDIPDGSSLGERIALSGSGSVGTEQAISNTIAQWDTVIDGIADTSGLAAGDIVHITNDEAAVPGHSSTKGEINKVASVDSGTQVTLVAGALFGYGTTGLTIAKASTISNVRIHGLTVQMGGEGSAHSGIHLTHVSDSSITNTEVYGAEDTGIRVEGAWAVTLDRYHVVDSTSPGGTIGNTGYGVAVIGPVRDIDVSRGYSRNCRHHISGGGSVPAAFVTVSRNYATQSSGAAAYDCHEPTFYWTFEKNWAVSVLSGFLLRGQHITSDGDIVIDAAGDGISARSFDGVTEQRGVAINNPYVDGCGGSAVRVDGRDAGGAVYHRKHNCRITNATAINIDGTGIILANFEEATLSGNDVTCTGTDVDALALIESESANTSVGAMVGANRFYGTRYGIQQLGAGAVNDSWIDGNLLHGDTGGINGVDAANIGTNRTV